MSDAKSVCMPGKVVNGFDACIPCWNDIMSNLIHIFVCSPVCFHDFTRYHIFLFCYFLSFEIILVHFMYSYSNSHLLAV